MTEFFQDCDTDYAHDGSTRNYWVAETLRKILAEPQPSTNTPPETFSHVIRTLMDHEDDFYQLNFDTLIFCGNFSGGTT